MGANHRDKGTTMNRNDNGTHVIMWDRLTWGLTHVASEQRQTKTTIHAQALILV